MNRNLMGTPLWDPPSRCGVERTVPRGWIVAVRPKSTRGFYAPAFEGAVFASKRSADSAADKLRRERPEMQVRVLREGLVK